MDSTSLREQELKLKLGKKSREINLKESKLDSTKKKDSGFPDLGENYEVLDYVGTGGMGDVYKVRSNINGDIFAIKMLKADVSRDQVSVKRFKQEVTSASKLSHANLVSVYKHETTADGSPYLVMDYYEGKNLADLIEEEGTLEPERAIDIFIQLGQAISHAHNKGVVHRDIKPNNVIVSGTESGAEIARVVDFGIAKVLPSSNRETLNFTETGDVFGSPEYMSPEQCLGFNLDDKSDIYSFGCLMYETLTGATPFSGNNPIQLVVKHINDEAPDFPEKLKESKLIQSMETIVLKCLEKEPSNRFQSMEELVCDLELIKEGKLEPKYKRSKDEKPTLTKTQAYGGGMLLVMGLAAIQYYLSTYHSNVYSPILTLQLGALLSAGGYLFGTRAFSHGHKIWEKQPLRDWWKQAFTLSTFLLYTVVGVAMLVFSASPFLGIEIIQYQLILNLVGWVAIISFVSMIVSGLGSLIFQSQKKVKVPRFLLDFTGYFMALYLSCILFCPNLAARLPVMLAVTSSQPVSTWFYERAVEIDPGYTTPLEALYEQEKEKNNYLKAWEHLNQLIRIDPDNPNWYSKRSRMYVAMGDTKAALKDNARAQVIRPLQLSFIDDKVDIVLANNDPLKAMAAIDRALYNEPGSVHFASLKAALYARMKRMHSAVDVLSEVSNTQGEKNPFLHLQRAEYYRSVGMTAAANRDYWQALARSKSWWHDIEYMPLVRAYVYRRLGDQENFDLNLKEAARHGLGKDDLGLMIYSYYSGMYPEW